MEKKRLEACLLGQALGDSMGLPYEGMSPRKAAKRWERFGFRQSFAWGRGVCSDDTEHAALAIQALWLCEGDAERFQKLLRWRLRWWVACLPSGVGMATLKAGIKMWMFLPKTSVNSAGNGAPMRSVAIGAFFPGDEKVAAAFAKASCLLTHSDPRAVASSQALAILGSQCAAGFHDAVVDRKALARALLGSDVEPCPLWNQAAVALLNALAGDAKPWRAALDPKETGVDGYCLRSVPFAIWLWSRRELGVHGVVREAALAGGDVDTHAAMACALLGASGAALPSAELGAIADWPLSVEKMREIAAGESLAASPLVAGWMLRSLPMMAAVLAHGFRRALPY